MCELLNKLSSAYGELFWLLVVMTIAFVVHEVRLFVLEHKLVSIKLRLRDMSDDYERQLSQKNTNRD